MNDLTEEWKNSTLCENDNVCSMLTSGNIPQHKRIRILIVVLLVETKPRGENPQITE